MAINKDIEKRRENYPDKFYQVLEKLDLVMQNWIGTKMGTSGIDELYVLAGIFALDWELGYELPPSARAFFNELVNPKNAWRVHHDNGNIMGGQLKAYADLRQFLIDNAERVTEDYLILMDARKDIRERKLNEFEGTKR